MCCNCEQNGSGNFTYIRFATNINGDNISEFINSGGLKRCFQSVITSEVELDVNSSTFPNNFSGKWFNICSKENDCCCKKFNYHVPESPKRTNSWEFDGVNTVFRYVDFYLNSIQIINKISGDKMEIPEFRDNLGILLKNNKKYYLEFNYDFRNLPKDGQIYISFGDGANATVITINTNIQGTWQGLINTNSSAFPSSSMVVKYNNISDLPLDKRIWISNFRLGTENCLSKGNSLTPIKMDFSWGAGSSLDEKFSLIQSVFFSQQKRNIDYELLNIQIHNWDSIKDKNPVLLIDRYKKKQFKLQRNHDGVDVYRKAGFKHENPDDAQNNGRINEILLTSNKMRINFNQDRYFRLNKSGEIVPTGDPQNVNKRSEIFGGWVYLAFRIRYESGTGIVETGQVGILRMNPLKGFKDSKTGLYDYTISYNYK